MLIIITTGSDNLIITVIITLLIMSLPQSDMGQHDMIIEDDNDDPPVITIRPGDYILLLSALHNYHFCSR
jgi:hypothetical protein